MSAIINLINQSSDQGQACIIVQWCVEFELMDRTTKWTEWHSGKKISIELLDEVSPLSLIKNIRIVAYLMGHATVVYSEWISSQYLSDEYSFLLTGPCSHPHIKGQNELSHECS